MSGNDTKGVGRRFTAADLVGSWRIVDWRTEYSDGRPPTFPFGESPKGMILYLPDGRMSASVMRSDRPKLSDNNTRRAPMAEKAAAFESYFAYAGPYEVLGDRVVHKVMTSHNPNIVGTDQVRMIEMQGDELVLSASESDPKTGVSRKHSITWRR